MVTEMSDQTAIRAKVLAGICPFCDKGPFHVVAGHTVRVHNVNSRELRDAAGLYYSDTITSPEYHEARVTLSRRQYIDGRYATFLKAKLGQSHDLSQAAIRLQKRKAAQLTPEKRKRVGRKHSADRLAASAERDKEIKQLLDAGMFYREIAERMQINPRTVRAVVRRHGWVLGDNSRYEKTDGRVRYWASRKGQDSEALRKGRATHRANIAADNTALLNMWNSGVTVYELAEQRGVKVAAIRTRLRNLGATVPDGRADPDRPKRPRITQPLWYCSLANCHNVGRARGMCSMHYQRWAKTQS
jgi:transposase